MSTTWDEIVEENKQVIKYSLVRSPEVKAFYEKLLSQTKAYFEAKRCMDPKFSTNDKFMDKKLLLAWLISAEHKELQELGLEWRVSFCATCYESDPLMPYHVELIKA